MQTTNKRKKDLIKSAEFYLDMVSFFDMEAKYKKRFIGFAKSAYRKAMKI